MPLLGAIIKAAIELRGALSSDKSPAESQRQVLRDLLEQAQETAFGKYYNFPEIVESDDIQKTFSQSVPYHDYHRMKSMWWKQTQKGFPDISWPGTPSYLARSSGTTGKESKFIPVTSEMESAIQMAGIKQVGALANFDVPSDFFEKEVLMLGSSTSLEKKDSFLVGEISGISAKNIPGWFKRFYKPGEEIAKIEDWDKKVDEIVKEAKNWDIGALSGIPSWMEVMLKRIIEYHQVENIHEIWPNLLIYTTGGVAFQPYEKSISQLLARPVIVIDTYFASEGFIAFQNRPETTSMKLITDNGIYFEFVPLKPEYILEDGSLLPEAPALTIDEVEENKEYILIISTVAGAWRYIIGDTIKFTDVEKAEIKITGRTKFFMNVVGSQLSVQKMDAALRELEEKFHTQIPEFTMAAVKIKNEFFHHWYLGTDCRVEESELAKALDEALKEANNNYKVARSRALKGVKISKVPQSLFLDWNAHQKKKGGQVKMENVMSEEKFEQWENFVKTHQRNFQNETEA